MTRTLALLLTSAMSLEAAMEPEKRTFVICKQPGRYIGWPTIARTADGHLLVVFSGDRDQHVCPFGKTQLVRSTDGGKTWTKPETINNTPLDDRDAGILVNRSGTVLVTWFTSLAFEQHNPERWKKESGQITDAQREKWIGNWLRRSTDDGKTWGNPIDSIVSSPHGPIELADGRLLYLGINKKVGSRHTPDSPPGKRIGAAESRDDGQTWKLIGFVPTPKGVVQTGFHEPHVVECADGSLVVMIRHHGRPGDRVLWQAESRDGGRTWTEARPTAIWGLPPHLIRLVDGRLLLSYGHRRQPFGERALLSSDHGRTWPMDGLVTVQAAPNGDLGYPASVQLDGRTILTIYYQIDKAGEKTCLMGTVWPLPGAPR
jgi:hypothetical protein